MSTESTPLGPIVNNSPQDPVRTGEAICNRTLTLMPSKKFPRRLVLQLRPNELYVFLYGPSPHADLGPLLAYASAPIADCRFSVRDGHGNLWMGRASFDMSPAEMAQVRAEFEPVCIRETNS
jgi:hypothetical protein